MSQADMQLVRDSVPGGFNLAVGEPYFLQAVYSDFYPRYFEGKLTYPLLRGDPELLEMLSRRTSGHHVVVTNGAKQALLAACYALQYQRGRHGGPQYRRLFHAPPYWPTYPTIGELSHLTFRSFDVRDDPRRLRVTTGPNNPDGRLGDDRTTTHWDIWDAAYASRIYGWDYIVPWHRVSVWSAAKLFGPSGYRIGWLATPDPELATLAAEYVEKTTSGVANPSQAFLKQLLKNLDAVSPEEEGRMIMSARDLLLKTNEAFMGLSKHFLDIRGFPDTRQGMFAWVRARNPDRFKELLGRAKVKVVGGAFCGGQDDWFRVSLGVMPNVMHEAVRAIEEVENGST